MKYLLLSTLWFLSCRNKTTLPVLKLANDTTVLRLKELPDTLLTRITISPHIFQFDTVEQGAKIEGSFSIKNTGNRDFILAKIFKNCDCTSLSIRDSIISPGSETEISFEMNSEKLQPGFAESIFSVFGNFRPYVRTLKIEGYIVSK